MMTHIDLFSGIGGFALAARWAGFKTVCFVEIDEYCQKVIKKNFDAVMADAARDEQGWSKQRAVGERVRQCCQSLLYSDIRTFDGTRYRGATLLTGGFPCQPFSQAGKRRGSQDDRYLWPEMHCIIAEARPAWVVAENVAGIVNMELDSVLSDLEGEGYAVQALVIPACAVDAKHRRDRVWIIANRTDSRVEGMRKWQDAILETGHADELASGSTEQDGRQIVSTDATGRGPCEWLSEPDMGRVANGIPRRVDGYNYEPEWPGVPRVATGVKNRVQRLKGLGNAIQPQVAYQVLKLIAEIERGRAASAA